MKNLLQPLASIGWSVFWLIMAVLMAGFVPSRGVVAAAAPSDKELSMMGQGFGKFVGSFMQQLQTDEKGKPAPPAEDRPAERSTSYYGEAPARQDWKEERSSPPPRAAEKRERRMVPYRLYDPWGANRWEDPVLGFDPWERGDSWVDYDWNLRKRQYGRSYGGTSPHARGYRGYGRERAYEEYYDDDRYLPPYRRYERAYGGMYDDSRYSLPYRNREPSWSQPFGISRYGRDGGWGWGWGWGRY